MAWLISFQYREAYNGYHGLAYGKPKDGITVSDFHPAIYAANCASDILSLRKEAEKNPDTAMRMWRVTRIYFAMEVPEDLLHQECLTDLESDLLDFNQPDED
jgi:hypothetical protein